VFAIGITVSAFDFVILVPAGRASLGARLGGNDLVGPFPDGRLHFTVLRFCAWYRKAGLRGGADGFLARRDWIEHLFLEGSFAVGVSPTPT
jgi:hypothetical protein